MTHTSLAATAAALWVGGIAATGALADVTKPPVARAAQVAEQPVAPQTLAQIYDRIPPPEPEPALIVLPNIEIVGVAPVHAHPQPATHERRCSEWRPLEQGSLSVQMCE